jgi:hypothetical protein
MRDLSVTEIADLAADPAAVAAVQAPPTVPTGKYALRLKGVRAQQNDEGVILLRFTAEAQADGERRGTVFFDASPQTRFRPDGKPTREWRLYGQLLGALGLQGDTKVGDLLAQIEASQPTVGARVREVIVTPESKYYDSDKLTDEDKVALLQSGARAKNYVDAIFPVSRV